MRRRVSTRLLAAAAFATALMVPLASPAGAIANSCASPGGISMFPNAPAGNSSLKIACTLTTATGSTSAFYKTEDYQQAVWHFGAARTTLADGHATSGSATVTSASAHFAAADVNHGISGAGLPVRAFIISVTNATTAVLNLKATATVTTAVWTIENSDGRTVTDGATTVTSKTLTSATAHFVAADVGRTVSGTDIAHGSTISAVTNTTTATMSLAATATGTGETITFAAKPTTTSARQVKDGHTTSASTTVTSASAAFGATDVNLPITGAGIPANDFIKSVTNATTVVLNAAATATSTTAVLTIGKPNATAPGNGDEVSQLGAELALNPSLVAGSPPCTANVPQGFDISGVWNNPGSFASVGLGSSTDASLTKPLVGQVVYPTSVISFAGYVMKVPAATSGESDTSAHYDVLIPALPTALAVCPAPSTTGIASSFQFLAVSKRQGTLATGLGTPGTNMFRGLFDLPAGTTTKASTLFLHIRTSSSSTTDNFSASATCTEQYPDVVDFGCGQG